MENYSYIGWIPCINGHLDFGLMRIGLQGGFTDSKSTDSNCVDINYSCSQHRDSHDRRIVLQSKVDWRDSPDRYSEDSGKFRVIVTAQVNKSNSMDERYLKGNLLIYPLIAEPEDAATRHSMNVHILCHEIDEKEEDRNANFDELEKLTSGQESVDHLRYFSCSLKFRIEPTGITKIEYNSPYEELDSSSKYIMARQAFYYLKYSIHAHTHHVAKQDSLTTITPIYDDNDLENAGLRLICQLKRELTSLKRMQHVDEIEHPTNNAVGIIAYIESLVCSLDKEGVISSDMAEREQNRFSYVKSSFEAQNCKISSKQNNAELVKSKSKVWLGFVIISIWGILNFKFQPEDNGHISVPNDWFWIWLVSLLVAVFGTYTAIKKYYANRYELDAAEHLYTTSYSMLILKIVIPLLLTVGLIALLEIMNDRYVFIMWMVQLLFKSS